MLHKCRRNWVKQQRQRIRGRVSILIPNFAPPAWEPDLQSEGAKDLMPLFEDLPFRLPR